MAQTNSNECYFILDIGKQMLETTHILSLRQLLKIALELKRCLWQKLKLKKFLNVSRTTIEKQVGSLVPKVKTSVVAVDNHMTIIQVQIGKNIIEDVLADGGSGIIKQLRLSLGLPKLKLTPYNLTMVDQTTIKPMGLIKDLKIYVHSILYMIMFIILQNSVVGFNYFMLFGRPWLKDVKVAHDWRSNIVTIQGNGKSK
jgi:hypothetical protein